jgi:tetratricopeptide (TPR) repeat protein
MPTAVELLQTGADFYSKGNLDSASMYFQAALREAPNFWPAMSSLAVVLDNQEKLIASATLWERVINIRPDIPLHWSNYGNILMRSFRFIEAEAALKKAADMSPDDPAIWHNLALLYGRMSRNKEALECIDRALELGPNNIGALTDRCYFLMADGKNFPSSWEDYESRWYKLKHLLPWDFNIPEWKGESLQNKNILLHSEQGYGDAIMCVRFAKNLLNIGAKRVTLGLPVSMCEFIAAQRWEGVDVIDVERITDEDAKKFDFHSPMFSALRWLRTVPDDISGAAYLVPTKKTVLGTIGEGFYNVGICWSSGNRNDINTDWRRRNVPLELFLPLAALPHVKLWSLQVSEDAKAIETLGVSALIEDPTKHLSDWSDTASFVAALDLVVTVDTAVAHLSAALGKPTIMLSGYCKCWRWWDIQNGTGRPWYNSMEIFWQTEPKDWKNVMRRVRRRVQEYVPPAEELKVA